MRSIRPASPFRIRAPHFLLLVLGGLLMAATYVSSVASADNFRPFASTTVSQEEVSVAIHPDNPDTMLAAAMVGGEQLTLAWTFDAGETWTQYEAGGITGTKYDPSVVIRKRDGLWAVMTTGTSDDLRIFVSDDRGDSWSALDQVATVVTDETHDKEHLTVDNNPDSPGYGNMYAAWFTLIKTGTTSETPPPNALAAEDPPLFSFSDPGIEVSRAEWDASDSNYNGAFEWSDPVNVTDSLLGDTYQMVQDPSVAVGPGGDVYVAFNLFAGPPGDAMGAPTAIGIVGGDGTGTWATAWDEEDVAIVDGGFRRGSTQPRYWSGVHSYPVLAVDHSDGDQRGRVYLTWVSDDNGGDVKVVSALPGSGETPDFNSGVSVVGTTPKSQFLHWATCDPADGRLWVGYYDCSDDPSNEVADFVLSASRDGGSTWTTWQANDDSLSFEYDDLNLDSSGYFWGHYTGLAALDGQVVAMWMGPVAGDVGIWVNRGSSRTL